MNDINCDLPCVVARSVKILSTDILGDKYKDKDKMGASKLSYIVCSFSDGRAITMSMNHQIAQNIS
jgi:hypothetical protein